MNTRNHIVKYGLYMFLGISGLFLIMKAFGLEHLTVLRFLNGFIVVFFSIRMAKVITQKKGGLDYLDGLFGVLLANIFALVLSVIGLMLYIGTIGPELVVSLQESIWFAGDLTTTRIVGVVFIEGAAMAMIVSFAVMQYYKDRGFSKAKKEKTLRKV